MRYTKQEMAKGAAMASTDTLMTRNETAYEMASATQTKDRNVRVRDLTPAQRRAVVFAQQQVIRAKAAKRAKEERQANLNKMWMEEDGMEAGRQHAVQTKQNQAVSHTVSLREALGHVLRELRTNDHKTLREVSEKAGVSLGYLSEVERGQKEASSELLSSIAEALGLGVPQTLRMVADYLESVQE